MTRFLPSLMLVGVLPLSAPAATPAQTLRAASDLLDDRPASLPPLPLATAHGVAIFPRVVKAGLVVGGRGGDGVVLVRAADGRWSDPIFVTLGGASLGLQVGVESSDVVMVIRSRRTLDRLFAGKGKITLGVDAAAAVGPVGRHTAAATDGRMQADILTYTRSRGLFAGVALDGAVIRPDADANAAFAADDRLRPLAAGLRSGLAAASATPVTPLPTFPPPVVRPEASVVPPAVPGIVPPVVGAGPAAGSPDKIKMTLSGLAAAAVGLAYRSARRKVSRRWAAA